MKGGGAKPYLLVCILEFAPFPNEGQYLYLSHSISYFIQFLIAWITYPSKVAETMKKFFAQK